MKKLIAIFLVAALAACQGQTIQTPSINKQQAGTALGGVAGAVIGSKFGKGDGQLVGTAMGALLGAYLGNSIGQSLDNADMMAYERTSQQALETNKTGKTSTWKNPDSGNSGTVTPTRTYNDVSNGYCREYTQTINIGGKTQRAYGTACRQEDGTWKITQ